MKPQVVTVRSTKYSLWIGIIIVLLLLYFFRPWFHSIVMLLYANPLLILFIVCLLIGIFLLTTQKKFGTIFIAIAIISVLLLAFTPLFVQLKIVNQTQYNVIDAMYESTEPRTVPLSVAIRYGNDNHQKPKERLGDFDPVTIDGIQYWTSPRVPNGGLLYFLQKVQGVLLVNAQEEQRTTSLVTQEFKYGENTGIFDNINWKLYKEKYFVNIAEIFYVYDDESKEYKAVAPFISYKFSFPIMKPVFGGVHVVHTDGRIETFKPDQIQSVSYLQSTRVYPEYLARLHVESYQYINGVLNAWFIHEDQIEVADLPNQGNQQPFLIDTEKGLKWIIATEPYGESFGVFKLFFVDAVTGKIDLFELDDDQTLLGPVRVASFVRSQFPIIDWSTSRIVEPRPYIVDNTLHWMVSIVPRDFAGISKTVFVNARTNEVTETSVEEEQIENADEDIEEKLEQIEKLVDEVRDLLAQ